MQEESPNGPAEAGRDDNLEFKPVVKYVGIVLGLLLLGGTEYVTYKAGYDRGIVEATPSASATAQAELNATAVKNLTHFMQLSTESDEVLADAVANYKERFSWIEDEGIRREAEWSLARALIDRGKVGSALGMLSELFPAAPKSVVWARRAVYVADSLAAENRLDDALSYYQIAADQYSVLNLKDEQLKVISNEVSLLASTGSASQEVMAPLEVLQQEASALGEAGRSLQANILAYMGSLHRRSGDSAAAMRYFEKALSGVDSEHTPELASAAVCYGMALLEKGENEKAEAFLRDGVSRLSDNPADAAYLVAALRELARLENERGNVNEAMGMLFRAEGAAMGRIPADNAFWSQLYDQRGWLSFGKRLYDSALKDFTKALEDKAHPELQAQPEEGAARCYLSMGKGKEAVHHFEEAIKLRLKHQPNAKEDLGRLYLLLGNANDLLSSRSEAAVEAYTKALEYLPEDSEDRPGTMMSLGYALNQSSRWVAAAKVWEELLPLVKGNAAQREEVRNQLDLCRRHGVAPKPAEEEGEPTAEDPEASDKPAKQTPKRGRRNR